MFARLRSKDSARRGIGRMSRRIALESLYVHA